MAAKYFRIINSHASSDDFFLSSIINGYVLDHQFTSISGSLADRA